MITQLHRVGSMGYTSLIETRMKRIAFLWFFLFPAGAFSQHLDTAALSRRSDYIVHARVVHVTAARERYDDQLEMVMSRVTLDVLDSIKGNLRSGAEIRSFGGVLEGVPYLGSHFPRFNQGEELILFLAEFKGGIFPVGHASGCYVVKGKRIRETNQKLEEFKDEINDYLRRP